MSEVVVFRTYDGWTVELTAKSKQELDEIKRRLSGMFTFRTPKR